MQDKTWSVSACTVQCAAHLYLPVGVEQQEEGGQQERDRQLGQAETERPPLGPPHPQPGPAGVVPDPLPQLRPRPPHPPRQLHHRPPPLAGGGRHRLRGRAGGAGNWVAHSA